MKLKVFFAVLACKLSRVAIRLLGRGGTDFPGRDLAYDRAVVG